MGARREITAAVVDRYRSAGRADKGLILNELCAVTGWHRKHAVRALAIHVAVSPEARRQRRPTYGALSGMRWWRCGKSQIGSAASGSG
jgi:hypothetical protein